MLQRVVNSRKLVLLFLSAFFLGLLLFFKRCILCVKDLKNSVVLINILVVLYVC
jgi:hypothetical protein